MSYSLQPYEVQPPRLLCLWDSPGKNTGEGCHALLQGIVPTQGLNLCLLHCRRILLTAEPPGKPLVPWLGIWPVTLQWKYGVLTLDLQGIPCSRFFSSSVLGLSCGIWGVVPWPGIKPSPPALGTWSLSYWTTREVPGWQFSKSPWMKVNRELLLYSIIIGHKF